MLQEHSPPLFEVTNEQRAIGRLAAQIAQREIAPHIAAWDRDHTFPRALYSKLCDAGIMGILVDEAFGGVGADYISYALAIEELAKVDAGTAVTVSVHTMIASAIAQLGNEEQKHKYLPALATADMIAAFALTEPEAGSDAGNLRSTARHTKNGYLLNGRKQWCTNGSYSGVVMAMFRTGGSGHHGISAFLVDNDTPGLHVERVTEKLGIHTSNTCDLAFDDALVPESALLGHQGEGFSGAMTALQSGRIGIAAQACGILSACLDASVVFAKERSAFGKPIGAFEGVSFKIAQMATDLDAARLLTYKAAALCDRGVPSAVEGSKAKLFASTAARKHAAEAIQIHGGYGFTTEFAVERYYRDAKITEIYEGTSEIQQLIIARSLLGKIARG
ncbi:MAG: acyl-CoA dehydrogenase family protein [Candidatus Eremiobacteraeota bacterium]|nr:acyl-CoA dehydrogenase family protein [Candidatus Eremiobacteraeota bacterium]MDQ6933359.1 acyl-CoA dehydrogenase family protein [Candidatus Eremiobacteraeota bacterium]